MYTFRTISARLVLAISLIIALACGVLGGFSILQQRSLTRLALDQQLRQQYDSVIASLDHEGRAALAVSSVIAALPPVQAAIANDDRGSLATLLGGAQEALKAQGMPLITAHRAPGIVFLRLHDPKAYGDDSRARRPMIGAAVETARPVVGVEPGRENLGVFAVAPIVRDGKTVADFDVGVVVDQAFVNRTKQRLGVDLAVHRFDGTGFKMYASTIGDAGVATAAELKSVFEGGGLRREASFEGHPVAIFLGQIRNHAGQPIAVIELIKDITEYKAAAWDAQRNLFLATILILGFGVLLALLIGRSLSRPLSAITATMNGLSGGDTTVTIPGSERPDELGMMAKAVDVFRQNMIEASRLARVQAEEQAGKDRRTAAVMALTTNFEG